METGALDATSSLDCSPIVIPLVFPESWAVPLSPLAPRMEQEALHWLRDRGVITDPAGEEKFRRLSVGEYASWPFPRAGVQEATLITRFLSLWIFYDDVLEETGETHLEVLRAALRGEPADRPAGTPHLQCWWELGRACRETMSPAWVERHADRFMAWVASVHEENQAAQEHRRTGLYPRSTAHLARRRLNIGMIPNVDFLECQLGWELPKAALEDASMEPLLSHAAEAVAIINDIFGFTKDRHLRWSNLVSCLMAERCCSLAEALWASGALLAARVAGMQRCGDALLARHPDLPRLREWLTGLHHVVYGFAQWHSRAPRYQARHVVAGQAIQIVILSPPEG